MPVSARTLRKLMDAGLAGDELISVVESIDEDATPKRSSGAVRQARYRERNKGDATRDVTEIPSPDKKAPPTPPEKINPNPTPPSPPKGGSSPAKRAFDEFTEAVKGTPITIPRKLTPDRRRKIEARIREHGEEAWREACRKLAASAFCRGENDRGWRADLEFLCQPKSFNRLIEGQYDSQGPPLRLVNEQRPKNINEVILERKKERELARSNQ